MQRDDGFFDVLKPDLDVFKRELDKIKLPRVYVGKEKPLVDVDYHPETSISDIVDIASLASEFFGQVSFIVPLAECFDKKLTCIWSSRGLKSDNWVINGITPRKILTKPTSKAILDEVY